MDSRQRVIYSQERVLRTRLRRFVSSDSSSPISNGTLFPSFFLTFNVICRVRKIQSHFGTPKVLRWIREVKRNISFRFKFISANFFVILRWNAIRFLILCKCKIASNLTLHFRVKMRDEATECSLELSTNCERLGSCIMDWHFADESLIISLRCLSIPSRSRALFRNAGAGFCLPPNWMVQSSILEIYLHFIMLIHFIILLSILSL